MILKVVSEQSASNQGRGGNSDMLERRGGYRGRRQATSVSVL